MSREHRPPTLAFVVLVVLVIAVIGVHRADAGAGGVVVAQVHPPFILDEYASAIVASDASGFSHEGPLPAGLHPWFSDFHAAHGAGHTRSVVTDGGGGADAPARPPSRSGARVAPEGRPTASTERRSPCHVDQPDHRVPGPDHRVRGADHRVRPRPDRQDLHVHGDRDRPGQADADRDVERRGRPSPVRSDPPGGHEPAGQLRTPGVRTPGEGSPGAAARRPLTDGAARLIGRRSDRPPGLESPT